MILEVKNATPGSFSGGSVMFFDQVCFLSITEEVVDRLREAGSKLVTVCPECMALIMPEERKCPNCGWSR